MWCKRGNYAQSLRVMGLKTQTLRVKQFLAQLDIPLNSIHISISPSPPCRDSSDPNTRRTKTSNKRKHICSSIRTNHISPSRISHEHWWIRITNGNLKRVLSPRSFSMPECASTPHHNEHHFALLQSSTNASWNAAQLDQFGVGLVHGGEYPNRVEGSLSPLHSCHIEASQSINDNHHQRQSQRFFSKYNRLALLSSDGHKHETINRVLADKISQRRAEESVCEEHLRIPNTIRRSPLGDCEWQHSSRQSISGYEAAHLIWSRCQPARLRFVRVGADRSILIEEYPAWDARQCTYEFPLNNACITVVGAADGGLGVRVELELELGQTTSPYASPSHLGTVSQLSKSQLKFEKRLLGLFGIRQRDEPQLHHVIHHLHESVSPDGDIMWKPREEELRYLSQLHRKSHWLQDLTKISIRKTVCALQSKAKVRQLPLTPKMKAFLRADSTSQHFKRVLAHIFNFIVMFLLILSLYAYFSRISSNQASNDLSFWKVSNSNLNVLVIRWKTTNWTMSVEWWRLDDGRTNGRDIHWLMFVEWMMIAELSLFDSAETINNDPTTELPPPTQRFTLIPPIPFALTSILIPQLQSLSPAYISIPTSPSIHPLSMHSL